ncbi:MAG: DUF6090 family protein [Robiginitalea sp.]|jgi:hypothetical protein|uniref:DUF6090 family protein n=1 Tax=Robiginitalea sp. TaxID=1902411 RepID=UPI003C70D9D6
MLRFFRTLRQRLLTENKFSRYLLYAVGEILLVVIGILIALQVNTWNEERVEKGEEQAILRQLKTEFTLNLAQLDDKIKSKETLMSSARALFGYIDRPETRVQDSVDFHLGRTIPFSTFDPIVNDLASSGALRLIRSDSLKLMLSLWTSDIKNVQEDELAWKFYRNYYYVPFLVEHYQLRTIRDLAIKSGLLNNFLITPEDGGRQEGDQNIGRSVHKVDSDYLLSLPNFEDHLERALTSNTFSRAQSLILREKILGILALLDGEIALE